VFEILDDRIANLSPVGAWRRSAEADIERRTEDFRAELRDTVLALERFDGAWPGSGGPVTIRARHRLRRNHPAVARYGERFRSLNDREIEAAVQGRIQGWRSAVGL